MLLDRPFFTIVIPTFDRPQLLDRALQRCLRQDFENWEAVVIDDASPDVSAAACAEVVRRLVDPRIRLIRHDQNRGVCEARNTGTRAAHGSWLIFHDDDDELLPGALMRIHGVVESTANRKIHRHIFTYRDDDGLRSPEPALPDGAVWEYRQYLEWLETVGERTDFLNCIHRTVFESVAWPSDRSREELFHFDLARRFRTACHSDVMAIIHTDASNRFTAVPGYRRLLRMAPDLAGQTAALLKGHGEALKQWAPRAFARLLRNAAINYYLAGNRARGLHYSTAFLRYRPLAPSGWGVLLLGLGNRRALAAVVALGKRRQNARARARYRRTHR